MKLLFIDKDYGMRRKKFIILEHDLRKSENNETEIIL